MKYVKISEAGGRKVAQAVCKSSSLQLFGIGIASVDEEDKYHRAGIRVFMDTMIEDYPQNGSLHTLLIDDRSKSFNWVCFNDEWPL